MKHVLTSLIRVSKYWSTDTPKVESRSDIALINRGGKHGHTHTWMEILNPSTSAKPVMTKLQNLSVALVNMDTFQMTLKLSLFTVEF